MAKKKGRKQAVDKDEPWDPSETCDVPIPVLLEAVKTEGVFSYDLETTGLSPRNDRIEGVAFYVPNEKTPERRPIRAWYPFTKGTMDHTADGEVKALREPLPQAETMRGLREIWRLKNVIGVRHNGIFDDQFLYLASGLDEPLVVENIIADSMLADYVADERHRRYGLKLRVEQVFGHKMTTYMEAIGGQASFGFANKKPLGVYAVDDCAWTYRLWKWAMERIREQDPPRKHKDNWCSPLDDTPGVYSDLEKVFWRIEMRIQRILMEMELTGCFIDWEWLVKVQEKVNKEQEEILEEFKQTVGWVPNLRSPKQVSDFLYNPTEKGGLGLPTKGVDYNEDLEQYATGDKAISHRKSAYPLVGKMLKYRSLSVIDNSFCKKLIKISQEDNNQRVHARFRQTGTVIGRLSCVSGSTILETSVGSVAISELDMSEGNIYTIETHQGRRQRILRKIYKGLDAMYEVKLDGGQTIKCTKDHRFLTPEGWRKVGDLTIGADLVVPAGVHQARHADQERSKNRAGRGIVRGDLHHAAGHSGRADGEVRNLLPDADCVPAGLWKEVCSGAEEEAGRESFQGDEGTGAERRTLANGVQAQDQGGPPQGEARRARSSGAQGRAHRTSPQYNRAPRPEEHQTPRHQTVAGVADVPFQARTRRFVTPGCDGPRLFQGGSSLLRQSTGVLPQAVSSICPDQAPLRGPEVVREEPRLLPETRNGREGSRDLFNEPRRASAIDGAPRLGDSTSATAVCLQELGGGLHVPGGDADGRGGRAVPRDLRGDQVEGRAQAEGLHGDGLRDSSVHDQGGRRGDWPRRIGDRVFDTAAIKSIEFVGVQGVWDISVEEDESYLSQGFVNHNSADPVNLMNQPRDKDLIRKAFCAHLENDYDEDRSQLCLIDADYGQMELRMAAHLANEKNMIEVYSTVGGCSAGPDGGPCERYTFYECFSCHKKAPPVETPDGPKCSSCGAHGGDIEHQKRCRHVDLHQRTSEDVGIPRNPLAKCLDGSTLVLGMQPDTGRSWIQPTTIEDLVGEIEPNEHRSVPVTTVATAEGVATAHTALKRYRRPTKIIVTKRAVVIATEDHRFQVFGDYGSLDPNTPSYAHVYGRSLIEAQNLEKGMKLPFIDMAHEQALDPVWQQRGWSSTLEINPFTKEVQKGGPASIKLDDKWAYFAGIFAGDGCASGNACSISHGHTPEYKEWRSIVRDACDAVGLPTSMRSDKRQTAIGSRVVRRYLSGLRICEELGKGDQGAKIMRVPPWVLSGGPRMMWSYIAGVFDTDGTVGKKANGTASFTTKSPEFAGQMAFMLRWLGMPILVQPGFNKTYERWYYTIHVLGEGIERFAKYCPMRFKEKVDRLHERATTIKRKCAPASDEVLAVIDGGKRTVYDFQIDTEDHLYNQGGLVGHNNANFGLLYRMGAPKFCVYAGLHDEDGNPRLGYGQDLINKWHAAYPGIATWHERTINQLAKDDYIAYNIARRRRRLNIEWRKNDYRAGTQAIQFRVSGSCQDLIKLAMIKLYEYRNMKVANSPPAEAALWAKFRFMIQVHDELIFEGPKAIKEELCALVKECMESAAGGLRIPFTADARAGRTWDELH